MRVSHAVVATAVLLAGCRGDSDLSRDKAQSLLSAAPQFTEPSSELPWYQGGRQEWVNQGEDRIPGSSMQFSGSTNTGLRLINSARRRITDITGITDAVSAPGVKEVQFSWTYDPFPPLAKRFAVQRGTGVAYFRKYDDGWRLEEVDRLISFDSAPVFTETELTEISRDVEAERNRLATEATNRQQRIAQLQQTINESKQATRTLNTIQLFLHDNMSSNGRRGPLTITDAHFVYADFVSKRPYTEWFGFVKEISLAPATSGWQPSITVTQYGTGGDGLGGPIQLYFESEQVRQEAFNAITRANSAWWARYRDAWLEAASLGLLGAYIRQDMPPGD